MDLKKIKKNITSDFVINTLNETVALTFGLLGFSLIALTFAFDEIDSTIGQNYLLIALGCFGAYGYFITLFFGEEGKRQEKVRNHVCILLCSVVSFYIYTEILLFIGSKPFSNPLVEVVYVISYVFITLFLLSLLSIMVFTFIRKYFQSMDKPD